MEQEKKLHANCTNLLSVIERFNFISSAVATAIVTESKIKNRVKIVEKLINVAYQLRLMNNFHYVIAIISGLNNSSVHRLKWTNAKISKQSMKIRTELETLMSMEGSFKNYRAAMAKIKPPCIPYIGVCLTDLTFSEDGNPDKIGSLINFAKFSLIHRVISSITQYQSPQYSYQLNAEIQSFIQRLPRLSDDELYKLSLQIEPRNVLSVDIQ